MADEPQVTTSSEHVEPVFVPEQVRRAAARADELARELAAGRTGDEPVQPAGATPPAPRPEGHEPPPPAEPPAASSSSDTSFEQRYNTLQGKYNAETAGLRAQVASLERLVATMQTPPAPPAPAPAPAGGPLRFQEDDVDVYGQDFLEAAARAAAARYEPIITNLQNEISQLKGGQSTIHAQTVQDKVFAELNKDPELDGWEQLNTDPRFIQWLQGIDEYAGVPRNQMLQHAYANGDAIRTGRFFKKYMAETGHTVTPSRPSPQTGRAPRPNGNGHMTAASGTRLEDMVVPGRAAGPGPTGSNGAQEPRIWSRPEITRFYRDRTDGRFRGREGESDALERDILAAAQEGRIH